MGTTDVAYRHEIRVRFGEVDQQGVVFNAHYLAYIDDALECWIVSDPSWGNLRQRFGWDMMLKRFSIEWSGSLGNGDVLTIDAGVVRWGGSSWTAVYVGRCEERPVFRAEVLYVSVELEKNTPFATPAGIREALGHSPSLAEAPSR